MIKRGFTISEMLVVMVIIGIISAVTIPMFTMKEKIKDYEISSITCARTELASSVTFPSSSATYSTACDAAIKKAQYGKENAIDTLAFLMSNGKDANEKTAAAKILRTACDNGGDKACGYFVKACQKDSTLCDTGGLYDLRYYLELMPNTNDSAKFLMYDQAKPLYDSSNTNVKTAVDNLCCPNINMACYIKGCTECPWVRRYGGTDRDYGQSIALSGNYIYVTGAERSNTPGTHDIYVMKLNKSDGTTVWKKHYGGANYDSGNSIVVSGNYIYVSGQEDSDTAGVGDVLVMKLNVSDGTTVWKKHYGGGSTDFGNSIAVSGNYIYVSGTEYSTLGVGSDIFVMQLNAADGVAVWKKHYGGASMDYGQSIAVSGNYVYVTGNEKSDIATTGLRDIFVMQINAADGVAVWKKHYGGTADDLGYSIAVSGSYLYVTGLESSDTAGNTDIFVMQLNAADGVAVWKKHYGGTDDEVGSSIALSPDGNFLYVSGFQYFYDTWNNDLVVMKLNSSNGNVVWKNHFGGTYDDDVFTDRAILATDNFLYITGENRSDSAGHYDIFVMKLNTNQTASNITNWTANGNAIKNTVAAPTRWATAGTLITGGNGIDIKNTVAAPDLWATAGTVTTGGNGTDIGAEWTANGTDIGAGWTANGDDIGAAWTADGLFVRKTTDGSNYWIYGLIRDGLPIP